MDKQKKKLEEISGKIDSYKSSRNDINAKYKEKRGKQISIAMRLSTELVVSCVVGAVLGWGFAPWSGGPLSWLDILGTPYAAERSQELCKTYGPRFDCPPLLADMGKNNEAFYERFSPEKLD